MKQFNFLMLNVINILKMQSLKVKSDISQVVRILTKVNYGQNKVMRCIITNKQFLIASLYGWKYMEDIFYQIFIFVFVLVSVYSGFLLFSSISTSSHCVQTSYGPIRFSSIQYQGLCPLISL